QRQLAEKSEPGAAADHHAALDEELRRDRADETFREWLRLRHEGPVPGADRPVLRGVGPHMIIRHHVHQADLDDPIRVIEAHAMRRTCAAIVTRDEITGVAELL